MPLVAIVLVLLLLILTGAIIPLATFIGWLLVIALGVLLVCWIVARSELFVMVGAFLFVGAVFVAGAYLLKGIAHLTPAWLSNLLARFASWVASFPPKWVAISVITLIVLGAVLDNIIWSKRYKRKHPQTHPLPGDPEYLDWANRRGKYARQ